MSELETLAERLGRELLNRGEWLATAESCTGGWVAQSVTAIAGSSTWFDRGFVTYSNTAKVEMLGVPQTTLERHGAVSEATARAMAQGALAHSCADWAVAVTGIAGEHADAGEQGQPGAGRDPAGAEQRRAEQDDAGQVGGAQAQVELAAAGEIADIVALAGHDECAGW